MNHLPANKQHNIIALIAMLALLLFMPLAKATHYAEHASAVHGIHCKVCSSSVLDDFDLPSSVFNITIVNFKSIAIIVTKSNVLRQLTKAYLTRAPPVNFH